MKYGEYIRTNSGYIGKLKRIEFDEIDKFLKWYVYDKKEPNINIIKEVYINKPYIVNHSKNIIDLIQAGDLVYYTIKGLEHSTYIDIVSEHTDARTLENTLIVRMYKLEQLNIKKILTKEQINENIFEVVE